MISLKRQFQTAPPGDFLRSYLELFHGGHRPEELFQHYQTILPLSHTEEHAILQEIAEWFVEMEERYNPELFPFGALTRAGVTSDDLNWWRAARSRALPPPLSREWPDASASEVALDWLVGEQAFPDKSLAMLSTIDTEFAIVKKLTTIGEGDRMDISIDGVPGFEARRDHPYRVLLMLKNDLAFYAENVGDAAIRVNGTRVRAGQTACMRDYALLQLGSVALLLRINQRLLSAIALDMRSPVHIR
jgi:hypothetical protein